jgi:hypothetical protein
MTQTPCAGVRLLLIQIDQNRLTLIGAKLVAALSKIYAVKLTAKSAPSPGLMILLTWILRTKILTQCAGANRKYNPLLLLTTSMAMAAAA